VPAPAQSFALTKIQPPRVRASLVARRRLEDAMAAAALGRRLVLVAAPAGFGKTVALTRLIERLRDQACMAWISVDHGDDPLGLLACLIAALEPLDPPWRTDPEALIATAGGSRTDRYAVATQVLNALAACDIERGLIVLDDAHRITDPAVFDFLDVLLERLPPQWGFVVASRADPPLASLARLRAHDELAEFRERELRFTLDEVRALLPGSDAAGGADREATSQRLVARTHGWAVGLRLAINGLAAGHGTQSAIGDSAGDRHVFDYLVNEVLGELPGDLRLFLLRCSVLAELTAGRCAAVSGDARAAQWLEEIERRGLFVSVLQGAETTLRLHDLFRDFLRERLRRELPDELPALYGRAAASEPDTLRRIGFLVRAGDWAQAEATLADAGGLLITTVGAPPVLRLIDQFPPSMRESSPMLAHMRCLAAWSAWDWVGMQQAAAQARAGFERTGDAVGAWRSRIYEAIGLGIGGQPEEAVQRIAVPPSLQVGLEDRTLAALVRNYAALDAGPLAEVSARYSEVLDLLESSRSPMLWYQCVPRSLQCGLPGMIEPLRRFATGALAVVPDHPTPLRAIAYASSAWADLWCGRLDAAAQTAALAESDARWLGPPPNVRLAVHTALAMLHAVRGRREASRHSMAEILKLFDNPGGGYHRGSPIYAFHRLLEIRLADVMDDGEAVLRLAGELPPESATRGPGLRSLLQAQRRAVAARVAWHEGRIGDARRALEAALADEARLQVFGEAIELRLRLARALLMLGEPAAAARALAPAFAAARDDGGPGAALAIGADGMRFLAEARWEKCLGAEDVATLREWARCLGCAPTPAARRPAAGASSARPVSAAPSEPRPAAPLDALSPRELEVLRLIAAGDSNKIIARGFDLSPHTVKRHVANILDKLGVESRGQAAAWYREHRAQ
jgi:LuxR family maltose regulon positive regulatory protein